MPSSIITIFLTINDTKMNCKRRIKLFRMSRAIDKIAFSSDQRYWLVPIIPANCQQHYSTVLKAEQDR